jgi:hypothetical protein
MCYYADLLFLLSGRLVKHLASRDGILKSLKEKLFQLIRKKS